MDDKFQNRYRIPSARATWHDYNGGAYFVTICTKNHEHFFGEIVRCTDARTDGTRTDGTWMDGAWTDGACRDGACTVSTIGMQFTEIGKQANELLENITVHNPYCEIPLYVVMPNHIHAIVFITVSVRRDGACTVPTTGERWKNNTVNEKMQEISLQKKSLSVAIGGFKSAVTKFANSAVVETVHAPSLHVPSPQFAWQPRFHDRIIRNQDEMNRIADYIENNPARWDMDCYNNPE